MNRLDRLAFLMLAVLNDEQEPEPQAEPPKREAPSDGYQPSRGACVQPPDQGDRT